MEGTEVMQCYGGADGTKSDGAFVDVEELYIKSSIHSVPLRAIT